MATYDASGLKTLTIYIQLGDRLIEDVDEIESVIRCMFTFTSEKISKGEFKECVNRVLAEFTG